MLHVGAKKFFSNVSCSLTIIGKDPFTLILHILIPHSHPRAESLGLLHSPTERKTPHSLRRRAAWEVIGQRREGVLEQITEETMPIQISLVQIHLEPKFTFSKGKVF